MRNFADNHFAPGHRPAFSPASAARRFLRAAALAFIFLLVPQIRASILTLTLLNPDSTPNTNAVKVAQADTNQLYAVGTTITTLGVPQRVNPNTNGVVTIYRTAGDWAIYGPTLGAGVVYRFLDSSSNATTYPVMVPNTVLTINYTNNAGTTNGGSPIAAGTGITITTSGGTNIISLYNAPTISAFANNQNSLEIGTTVTSSLLTWSLGGGAITSQSLDNSFGILTNSARSFSYTNNIVSEKTFNLTITDGVTTNTASTSVNFFSKIYWGASSQVYTNITDAQIIALGSSVFATGRQLDQNITTSGNYMYVCYPASFGSATFKVGGFADTGWNSTVRSFVNASGASVSYLIYQHQNATSTTFEVIVQ